MRTGLGGRTLRFRLTALLAGLVGAAAAVVGAGSAIAVHSFLISRLDAELAAAGSRYALALEHPDSIGDSADPVDGDGDSAETSTVGQSVGTLGARIFNGTVTDIGVIADAGHPVTVSAADRAVIATLRPAAGGRTVDLPDLGDYRIQVTAGRDGDILVTGLPERAVADTTRDVLLAEAGVFLLAVLVAGAAGAVAVRRSLRPLDRVTATALTVSDMPLASGQVSFPDRIPTTDPRSEAGQVATAVNHMLDRVEDALAARADTEARLRQFVADASHELRTPLAVSRSHAELLAGADRDWSPEDRESLQSILNGNRRMARLVDELLLLARMDAGTSLVVQPVDLSYLTLEAVNDIRMKAATHRWRLDLPAEPVIASGDPDHLRRVLDNLLANAATHTPAETTVDVALGTTASGEVRLTVTDDGPGIPPDRLPTITERFVRGDTSRDRRTGSTGLGLAIVSAVVTAHHGSLTIDNGSEEGVRVTVVLPSADPVATTDRSDPTPAPTTSPDPQRDPAPHHPGRPVHPPAPPATTRAPTAPNASAGGRSRRATSTR